MSNSQSTEPVVLVLMGSESDWPIMKGAKEIFSSFDVPAEFRVLSAHRTPEETAQAVKQGAANGVSVFIAGAGGAAHLAGAVAAQTICPVIGIPISNGALKGQDSLLATVQMPKGMPVATVAIDGAANAALLAVQILAQLPRWSHLKDKLSASREEKRQKILSTRLE